jgi:hypothetical protein
MAGTDRTARRVLRRCTLVSGPLTRTSDRVQVLARLVVLLTVLAAVPVAGSVATVTYSDGIAAADAEAADRHQVGARLLDDAVVQQTTAAGTSEVMVATVAWTGPAGTTQDVVPVPSDARAGSTVAIWVDRDGDRVLPPTTHGDAAVTAFGSALLTFLGIALVTAGAYLSLRAALDRARMRRWADEWAAVEPVWTRTAR